MPTLPWRTRTAEEGDARAVAMASRFRVRRHRDVPRFLLDSLRIHRQVLSASGLVGVALRARPLRREFLTLSAWRDHESLRDLVDAEPHGTAMRRHRPATDEATFVFFDVPVADLPLPWADVVRRLDAERDRREARTAARDARARRQAPATDAPA